MKLSFKEKLWFFFKLYVISFFLSPFVQKALALSENFELYRAPQAVLMGDAYTADVSGYAANFYNPAGLATVTKRTKEVNIIALDGSLGFNAISKGAQSLTLGVSRLYGPLKNNPGTYSYTNYNMVPGFSIRGFSASLFGVFENAAESDGTQLDVNTRQDVGLTVGFAKAMAGNLLKFGLSGKVLFRNQMKGVFAHSTLETMDDSSFPGLYKEGLGFGADLGMIMTVPDRMLPTLAIVWKDMFGTHFSEKKFLNSQASGAPDSIAQTVNAAVSIHPYFSRTFKGTIALEWKHIERSDLSWRKHLKFGIQLEDERSLYFWFGLNQLNPTGGVGLRVKGGNLEAGTYAEDIGVGSEVRPDRRFVFRYTIGF